MLAIVFHWFRSRNCIVRLLKVDISSPFEFEVVAEVLKKMARKINPCIVANALLEHILPKSSVAAGDVRNHYCLAEKHHGRCSTDKVCIRKTHFCYFCLNTKQQITSYCFTFTQFYMSKFMVINVCEIEKHSGKFTYLGYLRHTWKYTATYREDMI